MLCITSLIHKCILNNYIICMPNWQPYVTRLSGARLNSHSRVLRAGDLASHRDVFDNNKHPSLLRPSVTLIVYIWQYIYVKWRQEVYLWQLSVLVPVLQEPKKISVSDINRRAKLLDGHEGVKKSPQESRHISIIQVIWGHLDGYSNSNCKYKCSEVELSD